MAAVVCIYLHVKAPSFAYTCIPKRHISSCALLTSKYSRLPGVRPLGRRRGSNRRGAAPGHLRRAVPV